jgi:hypothetical protein
MKSSNVKTTKMKIDNKVVMLIYSDHAWGNRKQANKEKITCKADKKLLSFSKRLIDSSEYVDLTNYIRGIRRWLYINSVPSFFTKSSYLIRESSAERIENYLIEAQTALRGKIESFISSYEERINDIEARLGDQFDRRDYPLASSLHRAFYIEWKWITFDVPDTLPKKIFEAEKAKAEASWKEAAEKISQCLREAFVQLIETINKNLETDENGRQKGWKNSSFENVKEFIGTFNNRNIVNDVELENLVKIADKALSSIEDPQELKKDDEMRGIIQKKFSEISKKLEGMIESKPNRKFNFDE